MNQIGIMQGRLVPPVGGTIQAFPAGCWRDEFLRARDASLDCIEWIYDAGGGENPLSADEGIDEIRRLIDAHGVHVRSVCADYYMTEHLLDRSGGSRDDAVEHLCWLIGRAGRLECRYVILPFVDASSLRRIPRLDGLRDVLARALERATLCDVELHLETDLPPAELGALIEWIDHPMLRANLDIGNSASLGHDPRDEFEQIGRWLGSVHIKDRLRGGGTVPLGSGDADFDAYFGLFQALPYRGPFILQVARSQDVDEVTWARRNRAFVEAGIDRARTQQRACA